MTMHLVTWIFTLFLFTAVCLPAWAAEEPLSSEEQVSQLVEEKISKFFRMHRKAKKALLRTATKRKEFTNYFAAADEHARGELKQKIDKSMLWVQKHFHTSEMCLINKQGVEIARVVNGEIRDDLSHNEAENPFFSLGLNLEPGSTRTSPVYLSPDTDQWVVAYMTPIYVDKEFKAILHYEHELKDFANELYRDVDPETQFLFGVNREGFVLFDSRNPPGYSLEEGKSAMDQQFAQLSLEGKDLDAIKDTLDAGGRIAGYTGAYGSVGHWTIIGFQKE